jgi:hypothetical protein
MTGNVDRYEVCEISKENIERMAKSENIELIHRVVRVKFGMNSKGYLLTYRNVGEGDYSSDLYHECDVINIKKSNADLAARFSVDSIFDIRVSGADCLAYLENEGVGVRARGGAFLRPSSRALFFCNRNGNVQEYPEMTKFVSERTRSIGPNNSAEVRKIMRDWSFSLRELR